MIPTQEQIRKCARCGAIRTDDVDSNICGSCAGDLRAEDDAMVAQAQAEGEAIAKAEWEAQEAERMADNSGH